MDLKVTLRRVTEQLEAKGLSAASVSRLATGSPDTIRNWQRRTGHQKKPGASIATVEAIARVLDVPPAWLMGDGPDDLGEYLGHSDRARLMELFDQLDPARQRIALRQIEVLAAPADEQQS